MRLGGERDSHNRPMLHHVKTLVPDAYSTRKAMPMPYQNDAERTFNMLNQKRVCCLGLL
ncbi:hypothetical protein ACVWZW_004024 [Bradyrhizobium sp. F1.13.4]